MSWKKVVKYFCIIFASTILISALCTGLWIFLSQKKETNPVVSTPNLNITEEKINNFNKTLNKKEDNNNINLEKFNGKSTDEENISTLITHDEKTKFKNNNYNIKIENTSSRVKPVSMENFERKRINFNIKDEIGDPEIKKVIPKIENRYFLNDIITRNSVANNNDDHKVSGIKNSLEETTIVSQALQFIKLLINGNETTEAIHDNVKTIKNTEFSVKDKNTETNMNDLNIYNKNSDVTETTINVLDADRSKESLSSGLIMNKTKLPSSDDNINTERNLTIQTKNVPSISTITNKTTTEKSQNDIITVETIKSWINNIMINEVDKNESKFNTTNEETAHDRRDDDIKIKKKIELSNGKNITTTETNLNTKSDEKDLLLVASTITKTTTFVDNDNVNAINNFSLKPNFSLALNTSEKSGAKSLDLHSELNVSTVITTGKTSNDSETNIRFLNSDGKGIARNKSSLEIGSKNYSPLRSFAKKEITAKNVSTSLGTTEENRLINKNDSTGLNIKTLNVNSNKQNLSSVLDLKKTNNTEITSNDIITEKNSLFTEDNKTSINSLDTVKDSAEFNTPFIKINKEEITTEKIFTNDNTIGKTSLLINGSINSKASANSSNVDNIEPDIFNFTNVSIKTENHDKKSETSMVKIFSNDTKDVSENKTLNNDLKKLEIPNSTCNFSKYDKCKDLMIVKPTSIDSEDIIINKRTEIASGNLSDSNLYFNNGSDRLIIITPTIIKGENILNKDQNTSIGIKQILDSNLKNCTNGDGNELNNPEISSSAMDYSSILYDDIDDNTDDEIQDKDNRKCYGELGCLSITPTWYHTLNRNLNKLPLPREVINTSIIIYTREDPTKGQVIVVSKIKSVELINFNPKRKTKFIIHGFNSSPHVPWAKDMKNELLQHDDFNVIVVDWTGGSSIILFYTQTAGNTRLVGLEIAYLIKYLHIKYGLKLNDVHLIGHSLGAHIAGYAGEKLHGKIGRISGLDSAMPDFEKMPIHVRLDPTDAKLVDVIHTDSSRIVRLGIYQPCGHLDFYPNDGDDQPGCSESFFGEICDHTRAIKLFTESINSKCQFIAHECPRYEDFIEGQCFLCNNTNSVNCGIMGYHADKSPTLLQKLIPEESAIRPPKFFISTGDKYPYCRRHYRITIKLAKPFIAKTFMQGLMNVTFYGDNGIINNMEITPYGRRIKLIHGSTKQIIALPPENTEYSIGKIRKVELSWIYDSKYTDFLYICIFCNDVLYVESIVVDILELIPERKKREMELSSELCSIQGPKKYAAISSGSSAPFVDNCD